MLQQLLPNSALACRAALLAFLGAVCSFAQFKPLKDENKKG